ncbi:preprotein translocase subunit SecY [Geosporobacter ferrireducens]|uniref:Protein translocase subunit SecY n=1 Tax=Geosporobacter ferrireducens TaxID=1424294 RepID=A0A1D8GJU6_9FIRM|nr:preprotein translocase subunit SecY [Geosporobacter ferrireducens]AOT71187.1 preprotein translocase subunit SecY [Geosporobacter ferrireducens]MTI58000.1 preprotein translocase subunit SecY [Geosporobacter ferrireducens]
MFTTLKNAWKIPDLRKRMLYTLMMMIIFRLGSTIPVPGMNRAALSQLFNQAESGLFGLFNLISGGAFGNFTIFALSISPYITASIILQLLTIAIPSLEAMAKEGEEGRKKIAQYTRYGTVVLALIQATGVSVGLFNQALISTDFVTVSVVVITLTAGTAFLMWLGEQITEKGIGNGISLIIFAGIVSRMPIGVAQTYQKFRIGEVSIFSIITFVVLSILIIAGVVAIQQGTRKIPVQYAKRVVGRKMYGGHSTHIPLKVNQAGVIPIIFAISLLQFPLTITYFFRGGGFSTFVERYLSPGGNPGIWIYSILEVLLIIFFTYFYTAITFNPVEVSENMKKHGGFIPGIRPGKPTTDYLNKVLTRITLAGAVFLAFIAVLPTLILKFTSINLLFGGTSILIAVSVALETMKQVEAQMLMRHYQGFLK